MLLSAHEVTTLAQPLPHFRPPPFSSVDHPLSVRPVGRNPKSESGQPHSPSSCPTKGWVGATPCRARWSLG